MPGFADVRLAYDEVAATYAQVFPDTRAESPLDLAMIDEFARIAAGGWVLDAGCGTGRIARHLSARDCEVVGVDLSVRMVSQARSRQPHGRWAAASLTALPFGDGLFAGVLLWYSTIHTPPVHLADVFAEALRVTRPGGAVLVGFQSGSGVRDVSPAYRARGHDVVLERYLATADEIAAALAAAGAVERCRLVRQPDAPERDAQAVVLAVREPSSSSSANREPTPDDVTMSGDQVDEWRDRGRQ